VKTRAEKLRRCAGLLHFHGKMARMLVVAKRCGNIQTTASYRSALLTNAKVLRAKLLEEKP